MKKIAIVCAVLVCAFYLTGCSIIGLAMGAVSDARPPKGFTRFSSLDDISGGSPITLITSEGDTVEGEYVGLRETGNYERIYREGVSGTPIGYVVPSPRTEVTVVAHRPTQLMGAHQYRFQAKVLGFDPGVVLLMPVNSSHRPAFPLAELDSLVSDGGCSISTGALSTGIRRREIPFTSEIGIRDTLGTRWIAANGFSLIIDRSSRYGALTGFLLGAALDVAAVLAARSVMHFSLGNSQ